MRRYKILCATHDIAGEEFESLRPFAPLFPHRRSVLSRRLWVCSSFRYGCVRSLGYLSESSVCSEQSWRFELTQAVRSTKRKRHIRHLGQLVVCECLYVFFVMSEGHLCQFKSITQLPNPHRRRVITKLWKHRHTLLEREANPASHREKQRSR